MHGTKTTHAHKKKTLHVRVMRGLGKPFAHAEAGRIAPVATEDTAARARGHSRQLGRRQGGGACSLEDQRNQAQGQGHGHCRDDDYGLLAHGVV